MWEAVGWILAEKDSAESDFDCGFQHRRWKACGRDRNVFLAITAPCAAVLPRCSPLLRTIDTGQPPSRGRMRRMAYTILLVDDSPLVRALFAVSSSRIGTGKFAAKRKTEQVP
jgi:hypothetical protein